MNKEELIKNQFPNDEFLQSAVLQIVDKCVAKLEKENAELKERNRELLESCEGATMMYKDLCNAKEIIKKLKTLYLYPVVTKDDVKRQDEIIVEAEQFISKVEK